MTAEFTETLHAGQGKAEVGSQFVQAVLRCISSWLLRYLVRVFADDNRLQ